MSEELVLFLKGACVGAIVVFIAFDQWRRRREKKIINLLVEAERIMRMQSGLIDQMTNIIQMYEVQNERSVHPLS